MKIRVLTLALLGMILPGFTVPAAAQEPGSGVPAAITAKQVILNMVGGQFEKVEDLYDARMAAALPPGKLAATWPGLIKQEGAFQSISGTETKQVQGLQVVTLQCKFQNAILEAVVAFDPDGKIAGLSLRPHQEPVEPWSAPGYARSDSFSEVPLTVVNGKYELPGTLTVPKGDGPFPAVVLVQGSGPQDADETIGPNKPLKDLAWGLASHGIAVFRYVKRTQKYGMQSSDDPVQLTVEDEVIGDARAAVALVAKQAKVNAQQVFLVGHSLGAFLAPRIATGDAQIAGIVMMAANARPLEKVIVEQIHFLAETKGGTLTEDQKNRITAAEEGAKQIESPDLKPGDTVSFAGSTTYGAYWLDLRGYDAVKTAEHLKVPILILQGARDYQVTPSNFETWSAALAKRHEVTLRIFPDLNHLFITGSGTPDPAEYSRAGHVSEEVVNYIAEWILPSEKPGSLKKKP